MRCSPRFLRPRFARLFTTVVLLLAAGACYDPVGPTSTVERDQLVFWAGSTTNLFGEPVYDLYRVSPDGSGLLKLTDYPNILGVSDVSRGGRTLLFSMDAVGTCCGHLYSIGSDGTNLKRLDRGGGGYRARLSPDETRFAYHESSTLILVGGIEGTGFVNVSQYLPPHPPPATWCGGYEGYLLLRGWVSADRLMIRRVICGLGASELFVDVNDGQVIEVDYWGAQLSPDGTRLAVQEPHPEVSPGVQVRVINLSDETDIAVVHSVWLPMTVYEGPAWSANGRYVYASSNSSNMLNPAHHLIDLSSGSVETVARQRIGAFQGLSSSGDQLVFAVIEDDLGSIHVRAADGTSRVKVTPSFPYVGGARWIRAR
jgi:Tol biopolymer transport system component